MFLWFTRKSNAASQWIGHLFPMIFPMYINVYHISITQSGNSCFCRHIQTSSSSWSCMYIYIYCTLYIPLNPIESSLWSVAYPPFLGWKVSHLSFPPYPGHPHWLWRPQFFLAPLMGPQILVDSDINDINHLNIPVPNFDQYPFYVLVMLLCQKVPSNVKGSWFFPHQARIPLSFLSWLWVRSFLKTLT